MLFSSTAASEKLQMEKFNNTLPDPGIECVTSDSVVALMTTMNDGKNDSTCIFSEQTKLRLRNNTESPDSFEDQCMVQRFL